MRALVTGATGFLGSHLTRYLVNNGHDVAILCRPNSNLHRLSSIESRLLILRGQLGDSDKHTLALRSFAPEAVFHVAWEGVAVATRERYLHIESNVLGTLAIAELAAELNAKVFVGVGSQAEYGPQAGATRESVIPNPTTPYGAAKVAAFYLAREVLARRCRFVWARVFSLFGPYDNPQWLIPYVISSLLEGSSPQVTRGEQLWDFLYVADAVEALYALASTAEATGVFNLGAGRATPLIDIFNALQSLTNSSARIAVGAKPYQQSQVMHLQADIAKITAVTGWKPRTALLDGLSKTVEWLKSERADSVSV